MRKPRSPTTLEHMTTTTRRKKSTIPTHYSLQPPRPLSSEKIARLNAQGIEVLTLVCPMLPPLNEKQRIGKRQFFINEEYREKQRLFRAEVSRQVLLANWFTNEHDIYVIHYGFSFKNETKQDYDGPLKPTQDCLQQTKPTEEELWSMVDHQKLNAWYRAHPVYRGQDNKIYTPEVDKKTLLQLIDQNELDNWHVLHRGAIRNDGQVMKAEQTKHINQPDPRLCVITILKMTYETYITYARKEPVERFADTFLADT